MSHLTGLLNASTNARQLVELPSVDAGRRPGKHTIEHSEPVTVRRHIAELQEGTCRDAPSQRAAKRRGAACEIDLLSVMAKVRSITCRHKHRTLADLLRLLNAVLRGWCSYFRDGCPHGPSAISTTSAVVGDHAFDGDADAVEPCVGAHSSSRSDGSVRSCQSNNANSPSARRHAPAWRGLQEVDAGWPSDLRDRTCSPSREQ